MKRYKLDDFESVFQSMKEDERSFTLLETNYTKKIRLNDVGEPISILFSNDNFDPLEMKLINLVRTDINTAKQSGRFLEKIADGSISWYESFNMKNGEACEVYKIDIDSAYWLKAISEGIISKKTNDFFLNSKGKFSNGDTPEKADKNARLKALGSLATKKISTEFVNGEMIEVNNKYKNVKCDEYNRNVYLSICLEIDMAMKAIATRYFKHSRYYYWDCIFLTKDVDVKEVFSFIKEELGYSCKLEETTIYANFSKGVNGSIIDVRKLAKKDHFTYPVRIS